MADVFDGYPAGAAWDEMFDATRGPRQVYKHVHSVLSGLSAADLRARADALARSYLAQGVTFDFAGEERPFPLDVAPRVLAGGEWDVIAPGVAQRVRALEAFLADIYGQQRAVADGVVPRHLVVSSTHFQRAARGIQPPNGVRVHVSGIDVIRDEAGQFRVLEDNVRVPSGVSYVLSNRARDGADVPRALRCGPARRGRPDRGRPDAGCLQQRVLRALVARPIDGGRAGRAA